MKRISKVDNINITDISSSSVFHVGDSVSITPSSRALAVQREARLFYGDEGDFKSFEIFQRPLPQPPPLQVSVTRKNENHFIDVGNINIIAVAAASILHIGSSNTVNSETRIKHIRQIFPRE